jgi:hypothetical protein
MIDITARHIYDHAQRDAVNSWLRTLAWIRALAVNEETRKRPA